MAIYIFRIRFALLWIQREFQMGFRSVIACIWQPFNRNTSTHFIRRRHAFINFLKYSSCEKGIRFVILLWRIMNRKIEWQWIERKYQHTYKHTDTRIDTWAIQKRSPRDVYIDKLFISFHLAWEFIWIQWRIGFNSVYTMWFVQLYLWFL